MYTKHRHEIGLTTYVSLHFHFFIIRSEISTSMSLIFLYAASLYRLKIWWWCYHSVCFLFIRLWFPWLKQVILCIFCLSFIW